MQLGWRIEFGPPSLYFWFDRHLVSIFVYSFISFVDSLVSLIIFKCYFILHIFANSFSRNITNHNIEIGVLLISENRTPSRCVWRRSQPGMCRFRTAFSVNHGMDWPWGLGRDPADKGLGGQAGRPGNAIDCLAPPAKSILCTTHRTRLTWSGVMISGDSSNRLGYLFVNDLYDFNKRHTNDNTKRNNTIVSVTSLLQKQNVARRFPHGTHRPMNHLHCCFVVEPTLESRPTPPNQ
jgi:hypothetical protein